MEKWVKLDAMIVRMNKAYMQKETFSSVMDIEKTEEICPGCKEGRLTYYNKSC